MKPPFHLSMETVKIMLPYLQDIFDVARIVDPTDTSIITLDENNHLHKEPYTCFHTWSKVCRCSNCASMDAFLSCCQKSKYEFIENNVFYMISRPVYLDTETRAVKVVLEIVSHVSDQLLLERKENGKSIAELVDETSRKLYQDELTGTFNRRYLNEFRFLQKGQNLLCDKIALLLLDVRKFKEVNDTMGHLVGDHVLIQVAKALRDNIRQQDSLIRLGGDEFVIILTGCNETEIIPKITSLKEEVGKIRYHGTNQSHVEIDCGYAYTESFKAEKNFLDDMLYIADKWMYKYKKGNIQYIPPPRIHLIPFLAILPVCTNFIKS